MTASKKFQQTSPYESPWPIRSRLKRFLWEITWNLLCRHTPKPFNPWRIFVLRVFGAKIQGTPFFSSKSKGWDPGELVFSSQGLPWRRVDYLFVRSCWNWRRSYNRPRSLSLHRHAWLRWSCSAFNYGPDLDSEKSLCESKSFHYARSTYRGKCHRRGLFGSYPWCS